MVQIIEENRKRSTGEKFASAFSKAAEIIPKFLMEERNIQDENAAAKRLGIDLAGIKDPKVRQEIIGQMLQSQKAQELELIKQQGKQDLFNRRADFAGQIFGKKQPQGTSQKFSGIMKPEIASQPQNQSQVQETGQFNILDVPDEDILAYSFIDPQGAKVLQQQKDVAIREKRAQEESEHKKFIEERNYQTSFSKKSEEEADILRTALPRKEAALDFSREAIESGEVGAFSLSNLAQRTGIQELQGLEGAKLNLAAKEFLFNNISRLSAKAQNLFMEQRLLSMLPQIGKKKEANLAAQEMLEADSSMDRAYLDEYDRLSEEDERNFGFVRKDIKKRAQQSANHKQKGILQRASYRIRELEEQEKGLSDLKKEVGKNVVKGTPLTLAMAKLYKEKFKDKALEVAKKNGYYIPTLEEFKIFQSRPQEFRGGFSE